MVDTYTLRNDYLLVVCPRCGKDGFLTRRWVRASYIPRVVSIYTIPFLMYYKMLDAKQEISPYLVKQVESLKHRVRTYEYTGQSYIDKRNRHSFLFKSINGPPPLGRIIPWKFPEGELGKIPKRFFQVVRRPKLQYYVGHYDSQKYKEKMLRYKKGKIKSRPNGRTWCSVNKYSTINDIPIERYYEFKRSLRSRNET